MWGKLFQIIFLLVLVLTACRPVPGPGLEVVGEPALADSLFNMANQLVGTDAELAGLYLDQALACAGDGNTALASYHMIFGRICYYNDQYDLSLAFLDTALVYMEGSGDVDRLADCNFYKASSLMLMGNYPAALGHNLEAIELYRESGNAAFLSRSYNFQASIYLEQDDLEQAMSYVELAGEASAALPVSLQHAGVLSTRGKVLKAAGKLSEAGKYFQESYVIRLKCANIRHIASSLIELADLACKQLSFDSARNYLEEAENIYLELDEKVGIFNVYFFLAKADQAEGSMDQALVQALKARDMAAQLAYPALNESISLILSEIYHSLGNYRVALEYHEKFMVYHRELMSLNKQKLVTSIEYANALENQERDNELLSQRNRVRKQQVALQLLIIAILVVCLLGLLVVMHLYRKNNRSRQTLLEKENLLLENDLRVRNKELTGKTMELLHNTEAMQSLAGRIEKLKDAGPRREIESILQELKVKNREHAWDEFHTAFNHVHRDFYDKLFKRCPDLSATEIKIAALLRLNLSSKEIAAISYKSESAVKTTRHRLRQKLNLEQGEKLIPFLMKL